MSETVSLDAVVERLCGDLTAIRAPRGRMLNARSWQTEAPLRMLLSNLDPEVAEHPERLVVYGGSGRAARSHDARCARSCGRSCGWATMRRFSPEREARRGLPTHEGAPRVLIANSLLVPRWATWDGFDASGKGLTMFGQMTAGSWIYIGTQGILQGTYQTFAAAGETHYGTPDLAGRTILTAGLGGMGGAQPLAATMAGAAILCVEVDPTRLARRLETRYLDEATDSLDDAVARVHAAAAERRRSPSACWRIPPRSCRARPPWSRLRPRHRPDGGSRPADGLRPEGTVGGGRRGAARAWSGRIPAPSPRLDRGPRPWPAGVRPGRQLRFRLWQQPADEALGRCNGMRSAAGGVPAYIRPLFCRGIGPFRWAALSGDPGDIEAIDRRLGALFPGDQLLQRWLELAPARVAFQGLPARICWLGLGDRARAGLAINELVASGEVSAPVVIGRDHLDAGSVASPYRETEAMQDGSDAIADWPILNALLNTAAGATWVSVHHGGGVGIGNSIHAGMVVLADGTPATGERLERVLTTDPGTGVMRHADAGYPDALDAAREQGLDLPGRV